MHRLKTYKLWLTGHVLTFSPLCSPEQSLSYYNGINQYILDFQLELETTMRQECEAKLTLTSTNYETKIATLEKELEEVS